MGILGNYERNKGSKKAQHTLENARDAANENLRLGYEGVRGQLGDFRAGQQAEYSGFWDQYQNMFNPAYEQAGGWLADAQGNRAGSQGFARDITGQALGEDYYGQARDFRNEAYGLADAFSGAFMGPDASRGWAGIADFKNQLNSFNPYMQAGQSALAQQQQMLAPGYKFSPSDPSYDFRFNQGQRAVEGSAAAKGGLFSGAAGKELANLGQQMASQEYGNQFNRLGSLSAQGLAATQGYTGGHGTAAGLGVDLTGKEMAGGTAFNAALAGLYGDAIGAGASTFNAATGARSNTFGNAMNLAGNMYRDDADLEKFYLSNYSQLQSGGMNTLNSYAQDARNNDLQAALAAMGYTDDYYKQLAGNFMNTGQGIANLQNSLGYGKAQGHANALNFFGGLFSGGLSGGMKDVQAQPFQATQYQPQQYGFGYGRNPYESPQYFR